MLGIDVSKDTLACALLDPKTHKILWNKEFPNTRQGIERLLKQTPPDCPWALEPTGRYSTVPATLARNAGRNVLLAQPKKAQRFLQSLPFALKQIVWMRTVSDYLRYRGLCRPIRSNRR